MESSRPVHCPDFVLATSAQHRLDLFRSAGFDARGKSPKVNESSIVSDDPATLAQLRARAKALSVAQELHAEHAGSVEKAGLPRTVVLGFDQVASLHGEAFDKVDSTQRAKDRLKRLSGQMHRLHSAYSAFVVTSQMCQKMFERVVDVEMHMRELNEREIDAYIASSEWQGCVGCYQIEHKGIHLFSELGGDYPSIIGLPLRHLLADLRSEGINGLLLDP